MRSSAAMNSLRRHPWLSALYLAVVVVVLAEVWALVAVGQHARLARRRLERDRRELRALLHTAPAPTAEVAEAIEADLAEQRETLAMLLSEVAGESSTAAPSRPIPPRQRSEAYFDLAAMVERLRLQARQCGVRVDLAGRFGFATYRNEAPPVDQLAAIFRERCAVERVVADLLASQPIELLAVQRELAGRISKAAVGMRRQHATSAADAGDGFEPDARLLLRQAGVVETTVIRVAFTGATAVLRAFLGRLAQGPGLYVVRAVEVAPLASTGPSAPVEDAPLVARAASRFSVVIEAIDLESVIKAGGKS